MTPHTENQNEKSNEKTFRCVHCSQVFSTKVNVIKHIRQVHVSARPHTCPECDQNFKEKRDMESHIKFVHYSEKEMSPCQECGKVVKNLKSHMKLHSDEKPHECPVCNKKFRFSQGLSVHKKIHTGEKRYDCRYCARTFSIGSNRKKHEVAVHLGEKPFKCSVCSKNFAQNTQLEKHMKSHNPKKAKNQRENGSEAASTSNDSSLHLENQTTSDELVPEQVDGMAV